MDHSYGCTVPGVAHSTGAQVCAGAGAGAGAGSHVGAVASSLSLVVWQPWAVALRLAQPAPTPSASQAKEKAVTPAAHRVSLDTVTRIMGYMDAEALRASACVSQEWRRRADRVGHWVKLCVAKWGVRPAEVSLPSSHAKELYRALELSWRRMRGSVLAPGGGVAGGVQLTGTAAAPTIVLPVR